MAEVKKSLFVTQIWVSICDHPAERLQERKQMDTEEFLMDSLEDRGLKYTQSSRRRFYLSFFFELLSDRTVRI